MEFRQVKTRFPSGDGMDEDEMQISAVASTVPTRLTGNKYVHPRQRISSRGPRLAKDTPRVAKRIVAPDLRVPSPFFFFFVVAGVNPPQVRFLAMTTQSRRACTS